MKSPQTKSHRTRVLVIGMFDSIHFVKWLRQFTDEPIDFFLVASSPHRRVHPDLLTLMSGETNATFLAPKPMWIFGAPTWIWDKLMGNRLRAFVVHLVASRFAPQHIHAIELQNAGYVLLRYLESHKIGAQRATLIVTNYGSDIFWFRRHPRHLTKLTRLLNQVDVYSAECQRDVELARELGFSGTAMPVFPNAGGFSKSDLRQELPGIGRRNIIAVKGYNGWVGRADVAIEGISLIAEKVRDYKFVVFSCNRSTLRHVDKLRAEFGLDIQGRRKGALTQEQMKQLFSHSIAYVGISESDGISTSMLEAMAFGAIPVQTATACCNEWFTKTGVRVDTITPDAVGKSLLAALDLAKDPSNAEANRRTILERASEEKVKAAALQYYR